MKKILKRLKDGGLNLLARAIPAVKVQLDYAAAKKAHMAEAEEGDVYNGHPFEWTRRPLPVAEANRLLEEHDAKQHPEWDFQEILDKNLGR